MMLKKKLAVLAVILASHTAQAGVITYKNYSRDEAKNYVSGGGLDWLMWNQFVGGIDYALYKYPGWRLATNHEMAALFNTFNFGNDLWLDEESIHQQYSVEYGNNSVHSTFIKMFGIRYDIEKCKSEWEYTCVLEQGGSASAYYGSDENNNRMYKEAIVKNQYQNLKYPEQKPQGATAILTTDHGFAEIWNEDYSGVALVRESSAAKVSTPASSGPNSIITSKLGLFPPSPKSTTLSSEWRLAGNLPELPAVLHPKVFL